MIELEADDHADDLYAILQKACDGYQACDVMYALGMMVTHAMKEQAIVPDPNLTFALLRQVVDIEMRRPKARS